MSSRFVISPGFAILGFVIDCGDPPQLVLWLEIHRCQCFDLNLSGPQIRISVLGAIEGNTWPQSGSPAIVSRH